MSSFVCMSAFSWCMMASFTCMSVFLRLGVCFLCVYNDCFYGYVVVSVFRCLTLVCVFYFSCCGVVVLCLVP